MTVGTISTLSKILFRIYLLIDRKFLLNFIQKFIHLYFTISIDKKLYNITQNFAGAVLIRLLFGPNKQMILSNVFIYLPFEIIPIHREREPGERVYAIYYFENSIFSLLQISQRFGMKNENSRCRWTNCVFEVPEIAF